MLATTSAFLGPNLKKLQKEGSYGNSSTVKIAMGENPDFNLQYLTLRALADLPAAMLEFSDTSYTATYFGVKLLAESCLAQKRMHCQARVYNHQTYRKTTPANAPNAATICAQST